MSTLGGTYSGTNVSGNLFTPASNGTFTSVYTFTDTNTGCSNTSTVSVIVDNCISTGIAATSSLSDLTLYPNPTTGEFTIEFTNNSLKNIQIIDMAGRVVFATTTNETKIVVNIDTLTCGVYYVQVQSNTTMRTLKIVKQ